MNEEEIIAILDQHIDGNTLIIPEDIFRQIDQEKAFFIREHYRGKLFVRLPEREIKFFEWLKENDRKVWDDLWGDADADLYYVSIEFLLQLVPEGRGFPICDLVTTDNYYFATIHINGREAELLVDTIKQRFLKKEKLTVAQLLLMEISIEAIDLWHFCHKYRIAIDDAKRAVEQLVADKSIVHFTKAEHLANFIIL
ncbi:MAG: hypothetical protein PHV24_00450 [Candidatus Kapabacteria bacterium]|nr:hypothetical protein [Candidatus Kapabacteria bacterium]